MITKKLPLDHILSQMNPLHALTPYLRTILILSLHVHVSPPNGLFSTGSPIELLCAFLVSTMRATISSRLIALDFITPMVFRIGHKL
jgi:hypothetical protein